MLPFAWRIRAEWGPSVAVYVVHNPLAGWGSSRGPSPDDLADLVDGIGARANTCLVGHSSGGWAALRVAGGCAGVVGLAPWLTGHESAGHLVGVRVTIAHGAEDRVTSPQRSAAYVRLLTGHGVDARYLPVPDGHAMLRRARRWHQITSRAVGAALGVGAR